MPWYNAVDQREAQLREIRAPGYRCLWPSRFVIFVSSIDPAQGDLYVSSYSETLFGWTQDEWIADPRRWSMQVHPDDRARAVAAMEQLRVQGGTLSHEYRMFGATAPSSGKQRSTTGR